MEQNNSIRSFHASLVAIVLINIEVSCKKNFKKYLETKFNKIYDSRFLSFQVLKSWDNFRSRID